MKKKTRLSMLGVLFTAMALAGCGEDTPANNDEPAETPVDNPNGNDTPAVETEADEITDITIDKHYVSLFYNNDPKVAYNDEVTLSPTVYPKKKGKRALVWTSSNPAVATVNENGKVSAVSAGTCEVTVSNKEGTASASIHVVVNNAEGQQLTFCNTTLNNIFKKQEAADFVIPDTIESYETYTETTTVGGKLANKHYFHQAIKTSKEKAFLELDFDEAETRTEYGSLVPSTLQYVFYTTDQFETYLFKSSGKTKNYYRANLSHFIGKEKLDALKDVCNNFFVSGEGIFNANYEDILGDDADGLIKSGYTEHYARDTQNPGYLAFDFMQSGTFGAGQEDAEELGIPLGTKINMSIKRNYLFEDYLLSGKAIEQVVTYKKDGKTCILKYVVDYYFKHDTEVVFPDKANFSQVDSASDL